MTTPVLVSNVSLKRKSAVIGSVARSRFTKARPNIGVLSSRAPRNANKEDLETIKPEENCSNPSEKQSNSFNEKDHSATNINEGTHPSSCVVSIVEDSLYSTTHHYEKNKINLEDITPSCKSIQLNGDISSEQQINDSSYENDHSTNGIENGDVSPTIEKSNNTELKNTSSSTKLSPEQTITNCYGRNEFHQLEDNAEEVTKESEEADTILIEVIVNSEPINEPSVSSPSSPLHEDYDHPNVTKAKRSENCDSSIDVDSETSEIGSPNKHSRLKRKRKSCNLKDPKKKSNRMKVSKPTVTPPKSQMKMLDLINYNPKGTPVRCRYTRASEVVEEMSEEISVPATDNTDNSAPKIVIGENGEFQIDESSLVVQRKEKAYAPAVTDDSETLYSSFSRKLNFGKKWSKKETLQFYKALSIVGTDFMLMQNIFEKFFKSKRSRIELKKKYKQEERINRKIVQQIMFDAQAFDLSVLEDECNSDDLDQLDEADEPPVTTACDPKLDGENINLTENPLSDATLTVIENDQTDEGFVDSFSEEVTEQI